MRARRLTEGSRPSGLNAASRSSAAAKSGNLPAPFVDDAAAQISKAQKAAEAFKPVAEAIAKLKTNANDAEAAEIVVHTQNASAEEAARQILEMLRERQVIP